MVVHHAPGTKGGWLRPVKARGTQFVYVGQPETGPLGPLPE